MMSRVFCSLCCTAALLHVELIIFSCFHGSEIKYSPWIGYFGFFIAAWIALHILIWKEPVDG